MSLLSAMLTPVKWAGQGALATGKGFFTGGTGTRMAIGAGVGGAIGYANSDMTGQRAAGDALQGAAAGAGLMFGFGAARGALKANRGLSRALLKRDITKTVGESYAARLMQQPGFQRQFKKEAWNRSVLGRGTSLLGSSARVGASGVFKAAKFAAKHPVGTATAVGGLAATAWMAPHMNSGQTLRSPSASGAQMNVRYDQQAIAAQEMMSGAISPQGGVGTYPQFQEQKRRMQSSTQGLVQGLHRGRH